MNKISYLEKLNSMTNVFSDIIESAEFKQLVNDMKTGNELPRLIFAGVGKNWYICEKVVKTFISMGIHAEALDCTHALHGDLGILSSIGYSNEKKYVFFLSKSGTTAEMIKLAKVVKALQKNELIINTTTVSFNLNTDKPYAELFDLMLSPSEQCKNQVMYEFDERNLVPSLSITVMQLILDVLGNEIYESKSELVANYVYNHLGGSNGEKLGGNKILETV